MYDTVPTTMPAIVTCGCVSRAASAPSGLTNLANPKSSTLTRPRSVRIRLALLTSRCTIPRLCASSRASVTCRPISTTSRIANRPFRHARRQQLTLDILHHDEVGAARFADVVGDGDIGRPQQRRGARFVQQPCAAFGIGFQIGRQEFECDRTTEADILRSIHFAHPTGAKALADAVVLNGRTYQRVHGVSGCGGARTAPRPLSYDARPAPGVPSAGLDLPIVEWSISWTMSAFVRTWVSATRLSLCAALLLSCATPVPAQTSHPGAARSRRHAGGIVMAPHAGRSRLLQLQRSRKPARRR